MWPSLPPAQTSYIPDTPGLSGSPLPSSCPGSRPSSGPGSLLGVTLSQWANLSGLWEEWLCLPDHLPPLPFGQVSSMLKKNPSLGMSYASVKESACKVGDLDSIPGLRRSPWRRKWQPTPVVSRGESPWTEEPGGLQSRGPQRIGHDWVTKHSTHDNVMLMNAILEAGCKHCKLLEELLPPLFCAWYFH